jgi:hypothetical protein
MAKKKWTEEEKKAFAEKMKAARLAKQPRDEVGADTGIVTEEPATPVIEDVVGAEENVVGAKLTVDNSEIKSMLEDINEDSEVDIYNPLDQGFRVQFAITAYQAAQLSPQERDVREKAGLPLTKDMNQSVGHSIKTTILPSHKVTRLPGKVASVAIKQLRNYMMRVDPDNYADVADPAAMREYEEKIVMKIGNSLDEMYNPGNEIDQKISELNQPIRT